MGNIRYDFTGSTVLVTGASAGIGKAIAEGFAGTGATVYSLDPQVPVEAEETAVRRIACDVTNEAAVNAAVRQAVDETGRVDVVVNNAGILRDGVVWKTSDEDFHHVLDVHAGGSFRMIRACVPRFREQGSGRVINVTSYSGLRGNVGQLNYATAKAGIIGMTKTAAKELGRFGITVNAISPNAETQMVASIPDDKRAWLESQNPLGRFGAPGEMFPAVAFLASEEASYITGIVLPVDGGLSI